MANFFNPTFRGENYNYERCAIHKKTMIGLYQSLVKLFYAVAMCDGSVHVKEWDKVKELVKADWQYVDNFTDRYSTDAANQIEIVFDGLMEYGKSSEECFKEFKEFYEEHPNAFTKEKSYLPERQPMPLLTRFQKEINQS